MEVADLAALRAALSEVGRGRWGAAMTVAAQERIQGRPHGDLPRWQRVLDDLPMVPGRQGVLNEDVVRTERSGDIDPLQLTDALMSLHPWRKGPFRLHGVDIDAEWRSDLKWRRLQSHLSPLEGRRILDVGCGNGYYLWRMLGAGARMALGIDPTQLFWIQFLAVKRLLGMAYPAYLLPLALEDTPPDAGWFDTVFSMGVLYHRRSPLEHLLHLKGLLRPGGELVVETLVVEGDETTALVPRDRYAQMRNVWFIPSTGMLEIWLQRCGFDDVRTVDVTPTRMSEQRRTDWMHFDSLADYLDPSDSSITVEGHPAPTRAIVMARR